MQFRCILFTDANTGFITSATGQTTNGKILKTTNGGNTWLIIPLPVDKHMTHIYFVNTSTGYATGYQTILKTTDAGSSWQVSLDYGSAYLFGIYFINANTGFVAGNLGWVYKTTNAGLNWTMSQPQGYNTSLWSVWFINNNTGFITGGHSSNNGNKIFRTTDGGTSWDSSVQHPLSNGFLWSVRFINSFTGFITGYGQILKTTNSGLNWNYQYLHVPDSNNFWPGNCFFTNENTGYLVGWTSGQYRYIVKTTDCGGPYVGVTPVSNEVPEQFHLYQNYPNPFNPVTKINFALPKSGDVKLTLYDVLGREVAVLVNEKLSHGTYEVDFDGTNYPSGVYLYKLTAGEFTDTKKMILVK